MHELDWTFGYPVAIGLLILSGLSPYWYCKRRGWLRSADRDRAASSAAECDVSHRQSASLAADERQLPPRLVYDHRRGVGEIEAAAARDHRDAQAMRRRHGVEQFLRQTACLRPQHQRVPCLIMHVAITRAAARGAGEQALRLHGDDEIVEALVHLHARVLVVIQSRATQARVVELEAQLTDQVQRRAGIGAEANDVAGVGRELGLIEDDMKHGRILLRRAARTCEAMRVSGMKGEAGIPWNQGRGVSCSPTPRLRPRRPPRPCRAP